MNRQKKTKINLKKDRTVVIIYQPATRILSHQLFKVLKRMRVENRFKKSSKIPPGAWRLETTATAKNSRGIGKNVASSIKVEKDFRLDLIG
jgi:hypothetical protein